MAIYAQKKGLSGKTLGLLVGGVAVAAAALMVYFNATRETLDKETLCPSTGPKGQFVVLIDNTSPFPFTQKIALGQRLKTMVTEELPEGYLLSVFLLGEDFRVNEKPLFERCNPGQWKDRNQQMNNKKFVDRDFNQKFVKPFDDIVHKISLEERSKNSPIFQMLQLVGINGFERAHVSGERRLVIYSDMLANMPEFSMYKASPLSYADFRKTAYGQNAMAPGLHGSSVLINLLAADQKALQNTRLSMFWEQYFQDNGVSVEGFSRVEGL
ncbi:hypothetical protein [Pseudomonas syringae]|uniref:Uncharacterized protein n=4 Tax=Pseudomonas syringae TaxID=317 RepID=A0A9Q4FI24_PSESX|nr:hypothetical protein [Pseudomonas syringae]MCF5469016.1 hypothetical protein [Pseudomonas syringae]MCF5471625.1 hypothetical protein [Pseudomonas syringae]MCF5482602.1 hypothetical protein [Pseudomonas syringae]MCF5489121.1 hypothetical protein [Pseudomonas syringae]MCF5491573.1 hypothetical protein [Pseudomonas syringae]